MGPPGMRKGEELTLYPSPQISRCSGSIALSYGAHSNLCVNQVRAASADGVEGDFPADLVCAFP